MVSPGFSVCVSSEATTCSSLSSLLPLLWPSRPRLMPSTATATDSRTPTASPMASLTLVFPSDLPPVWTPSPRALMPPPRDTLLTPTATSDTDTDTSATTARGALTPRLTPTTLVVMPTLVSPSDPPPVWTPSPRALMHPPRDTLLTPTATSDTLLTPTA